MLLVNVYHCMGNQSEEAIATERANEDIPEIAARDIVIAGISGFLGILAMIPFFAIAYLLGALSPEAFGALAELVGMPRESVLTLPIGVFIFIGGGITTLPLLFVALAEFLPPRRSVALRGVSYAVIVWTGFLIAFWSGESGTELLVYVLTTLLAHIAYGYVLGGVFDHYAEPPDYNV